MIECTLLTDSILPQAWRADAVPAYCFNPALTRLSDGGLAVAFRVVRADGLRRVGLCRLDESLQPVAGSSVPWSDLSNPGDGRILPEQARSWFADPRFVRWRGRLHLYWNSGYHPPENQQFIQEIEEATLAPVGPVRTLERLDGRRLVEKNWALFEHKSVLHAFYTLNPLVTLRLVESSEQRLLFEPHGVSAADIGQYSRRYGPLRGGAPPLRFGNEFLILFHSSRRPILRHRYAAGLLVTSAEAPFRPLALTQHKLPLPNPFGGRAERARLNDAACAVVYPTGAILDGDDVLVSYGINDVHAAIARWNVREFRDLARPVTALTDTVRPIPQPFTLVPAAIARRLRRWIS